MPKPETELTGFSFGPHFTCAVCGNKITTCRIGYRRYGLRAVILVEAEDKGDYDAQVDWLKASNYKEVEVCVNPNHK